MEGRRPRQHPRGAAGKGLVWKALAGAAAALLLVLVAHATQPGRGQPPAGPLGPGSPRAEILPAARSGHLSSSWRGGETRPLLDPALFRGQEFMDLDVEAGYRAASEIPDVLDELFCYCFCEDPAHAPAHRSLRSCFTDTHAAQCTVCLAEALRARELVRQGLPVPEIERLIDAEFSGV